MEAPRRVENVPANSLIVVVDTQFDLFKPDRLEMPFGMARDTNSDEVFAVRDLGSRRARLDGLRPV